MKRNEAAGRYQKASGGVRKLQEASVSIRKVNIKTIINKQTKYSGSESHKKTVK